MKQSKQFLAGGVLAVLLVSAVLATAEDTDDDDMPADLAVPADTPAAPAPPVVVERNQSSSPSPVRNTSGTAVTRLPPAAASLIQKYRTHVATLATSRVTAANVVDADDDTDPASNSSEVDPVASADVQVHQPITSFAQGALASLTRAMTTVDSKAAAISLEAVHAVDVPQNSTLPAEGSNQSAASAPETREKPVSFAQDAAESGAGDGSVEPLILRAELKAEQRDNSGLRRLLSQTTISGKARDSRLVNVDLAREEAQKKLKSLEDQWHHDRLHLERTVAKLDQKKLKSLEDQWHHDRRHLERTVAKLDRLRAKEVAAVKRAEIEKAKSQASLMAAQQHELAIVKRQLQAVQSNEAIAKQQLSAANAQEEARLKNEKEHERTIFRLKKKTLDMDAKLRAAQTQKLRQDGVLESIKRRQEALARDADKDEEELKATQRQNEEEHIKAEKAAREAADKQHEVDVMTAERRAEEKEKSEEEDALPETPEPERLDAVAAPTKQASGAQKMSTERSPLASLSPPIAEDSNVVSVVEDDPGDGAVASDASDDDGAKAAVSYFRGRLSAMERENRKLRQMVSAEGTADKSLKARLVDTDHLREETGLLRGRVRDLTDASAKAEAELVNEVAKEKDADGRAEVSMRRARSATHHLQILKKQLNAQQHEKDGLMQTLLRVNESNKDLEKQLGESEQTEAATNHTAQATQEAKVRDDSEMRRADSELRELRTEKAKEDKELRDANGRVNLMHQREQDTDQKDEAQRQEMDALRKTLNTAKQELSQLADARAQDSTLFHANMTRIVQKDQKVLGELRTSRQKTAQLWRRLGSDERARRKVDRTAKQAQEEIAHMKEVFQEKRTEAVEEKASLDSAATAQQKMMADSMQENQLMIKEHDAMQAKLEAATRNATVSQQQRDAAIQDARTLADALAATRQQAQVQHGMQDTLQNISAREREAENRAVALESQNYELHMELGKMSNERITAVRAAHELAVKVEQLIQGSPAVRAALNDGRAELDTGAIVTSTFAPAQQVAPVDPAQGQFVSGDMQSRSNQMANLVSDLASPIVVDEPSLPLQMIAPSGPIADVVSTLASPVDPPLDQVQQDPEFGMISSVQPKVATVPLIHVSASEFAAKAADRSLSRDSQGLLALLSASGAGL